MKRPLLILFCLPIVAQAQREFSLTVYLPASLKQKLYVDYHTGKEQKRVYAMGGDSIVVRDTFYTLQAVCTLAYPSADPMVNRWAIYYLGSKPAVIRLKEDGFSKAVVVNAKDAGDLGPNQLQQYIAKEHAAAMETIRGFNGARVLSDSQAADITAKTAAETAKRLEYVKKHGDQYYSFYSFGLEGLMNTKVVGVDSLLSIFRQAFPAKYRNSFEGKNMLRALNIRKLREQQKIAPDFNVLDVDNNKVSLQQFRGKYVLINFWASWCKPCVAEFPALDSITAGIPSDKLVKIFITEDSDKNGFEKARAKYRLQGIHIFATRKLIDDYKAFAIPQVYLIDKEGKIVYDRDLLKDYELKQLTLVVKGVF